MKKLFASKSFLTMMSILSVLLVFVLLCAGTLMLLHQMDIISFSEDSPLGMLASPEEAPALPVYTKAPSGALAMQTGGKAYEKLIMETPFLNAFYVKVEVESDMTEGAFIKGVYEIWRYGDKYRIHRYSIADNEVEYVMICDGSRVQIADFVDTSITYDAYDAKYAFSDVAPIPNFRKILAEEHRFTEYSAFGDTCMFFCEYPALGVLDKVEFSKSTGLISYYHRLYGENTLLSVNMLTMDLDFVFVDHMFSID
jgi:hypothetical protein